MTRRSYQRYRCMMAWYDELSVLTSFVPTTIALGSLRVTCRPKRCTSVELTMIMSVSMNAMTERGIAREEQSSRRRDNSTESVNGLKVGICVSRSIMSLLESGQLPLNLPLRRHVDRITHTNEYYFSRPSEPKHMYVKAVISN